MLPKTEKEEEISEKIDEEKLAQEYMEKDKEKSKPNKNDFNKIVYVEYQDLFKNNFQEIDFLYDYSKILGSQNSDPKIIHWQLANLDRLFKYGIDISVLKKRKSFISDNIWWTLSIVPTIHQGGFRTSDVECGGCYCCNRSRCAMLHRREG